MAAESKIPKTERLVVNQAVIGQSAVAAAVAGQRHKVIGVVGSLAATGTVKFESNNTDLSGALDVALNTPFVLRGDVKRPLFVTAVGEALNLTTAGVGALFSGVVIYYTEGE